MSLCKCKTGCNTMRCKCKKNSLVCTEMCFCVACENVDADEDLEIREDSDGDDFGEL